MHGVGCSQSAAVPFVGKVLVEMEQGVVIGVCAKVLARVSIVIHIPPGAGGKQGWWGIQVRSVVTNCAEHSSIVCQDELPLDASLIMHASLTTHGGLS